jgi:hypothetical protein
MIIVYLDLFRCGSRSSEFEARFRNETCEEMHPACKRNWPWGRKEIFALGLAASEIRNQYD